MSVSDQELHYVQMAHPEIWMEDTQLSVMCSYMHVLLNHFYSAHAHEEHKRPASRAIRVPAITTHKHALTLPCPQALPAQMLD